EVVELGNDQATVVVVKGKGVQAVAVAPQEYLDFYGWLVRVFEEPDIEDLATAERAAQTRLDHLKDPVRIETPMGAALSPTAPITLDQLIPGIRVRVDSQASCRKVTSDFRLRQVTVDLGGQVSIDLEPLGSFTDGEVTSTYSADFL